MNSHDQIHALLQACGLTAAGERPALTPLTGGVSSEIFRIDLPAGPVCAKRALHRLKVAQDWFAPVERSEAEVAWIQTVQSIQPGAAPRLIAADASQHGFVMAYLDPDQYPCWKDSLRDGAIDPVFARTVGKVIGRIHAQTVRNGDIAAAFPNQALFEVLRMEPYLRSTATRHPDLAGRLNELADTTLGTRLALMHGDVSPKNILQGPEGPVFLDSECACYGDPAFDLAFCLNHLLLKSVWRPQWRDRYMQCFESLVAGYVDQIDWEPLVALEARAAGLLSALLLARVDGKSPVEYITTEAQKAYVRQISRRLIAESADKLGEIRAAWCEGISE